MKNWMMLAMGLMITASLSAQNDTDPPFKRFPTVPPINLLMADSTNLTKANLKKNQPTMIMYFSPGCDHCQHQTEDMIRHMDELKDIQIVMATYAPMQEMNDFVAKYNLSKYTNIVLGRDTKYMLQPFYKIAGLPYQALYDSKENLITTFEGNVRIDKLLTAFKKKD